MFATKITLVVFCVINLCIGLPILQTSTNAVFEMESNPDGGECQVCLKWYKLGQDLDNTGYFRLEWYNFVELDNNGAECCDSGGSCLFDVGCNHHVINSPLPNIFTSNATVTDVNYQGFVRAGNAQSSPCTPPGDTTLICLPIYFSYVLNNEDTEVTYQGTTIRPHSLRATVTLVRWPFASGSTGIKMRINVMGRLTGISKFYKEPGNVESTDATTDDFEGVAMLDDYDREGDVYFGSTAMIDGVSRDVPVTGLIATEYDDNGKYIDVKFPVFNSTIEYTINVVLPESTSLKGSCGSNVWCNNRTYFIIGISLTGGLCCCAGFTFMYCKVKRFSRKKKDGGYY